MAFESFLLELDGEEADDLYADVQTLEVELCHEYPATFRLQLGTALQPDGTWKYLDEERFRSWTPVTVHGGFVDSGREELFRGFITQIRPSFDPDPARCALEITGTDESVLMDREEKLKDWPDKKDSDIATEIFGQYGFTPDVEDTEVIHDEAVSTVIQRETDLQFLKRLALRNGFACWVEEGTAHFRPIPTDDAPQPVLAAHFGEETNLWAFTATVNALNPTNVAMFDVDRLAKEILTAEATTSERDALGELDAAALLPGDVDPARVYVAKNATTGQAEMTALCQGLFQEAAWFVSAEGEIRSAAYGHVLRPRRLVTIKGVGETYSGAYFVGCVRHAFSRGGYTQHFRARRDALLPRGDEPFSSGGGLLGGLL